MARFRKPAVRRREGTHPEESCEPGQALTGAALSSGPSGVDQPLSAPHGGASFLLRAGGVSPPSIGRLGGLTPPARRDVSPSEPRIMAKQKPTPTPSETATAAEGYTVLARRYRP